MKYNIIFSIPIHEKLEVVLDQVYNFKCFNPKSAIVFHISKGFNYQDSHITKSRFEEEIKQIGDVYINPESVRTGFADIIQAHISNFKYISSILDFDYFSLLLLHKLFDYEFLHYLISQSLFPLDHHFYNSLTWLILLLL